MSRKIKWNEYTLDVSKKTSDTSIVFSNSENTVTGQYSFTGSIDFNDRYFTSDRLAEMVGNHMSEVHKFKRVTGLDAFAAPDMNALTRDLLSPENPFGFQPIPDDITKVSIILEMINEDGIHEVAKYLAKMRKKLSSESAFKQQFGMTIWDTVMDMCDYDEMQHGYHDIGDAIMNMLQHGKVPGYNWRNCEILKEHGLMDLLLNYDDNFRGNIKEIRFVPESYDVIHTVMEDGTDAYWPGTEGNDTLYRSFSECLLRQMFPNFGDGVMTLYDAEKKMI